MGDFAKEPARWLALYEEIQTNKGREESEHIEY